MDVKATVAAFFEHYPLHGYKKRELFLHAEEPINAVFYIVDGRVNQYDIAPNGNEVVVNIFKPGAFFPISSAINDTANHYFFEAGTQLQMRVAPKAEVVHFLRDNPEVVFDLLARVYRGMDGVLRRMAHLLGGDAQSRLVFELLNAALRFGEQQPDGTMLFHLTEGDLAKYAGLARETVSRLLQELKTAGLVETGHGRVSIKSMQGLEARLGTGL